MPNAENTAFGIFLYLPQDLIKIALSIVRSSDAREQIYNRSRTDLQTVFLLSYRSGIHYQQVLRIHMSMTFSIFQ